MTSFDQRPDHLDKLRIDVRSWLQTGIAALCGCYVSDEPKRGFFQTGSDESNPANDDKSITTTARAYAALARVDQVVGLEELTEGSVTLPGNVTFPRGLFLDNVIAYVNEPDSKDSLNQTTTLHLARLADLVFATKYFTEQASGIEQTSAKVSKAAINRIVSELDNTLNRELRPTTDLGPDERGEFALIADNDLTRHYYVTTQIARARYMLGMGIDKKRIWKVPSAVLTLLTSRTRSYCIEQSFYAEKDIRYKHDAVKHAMATVLYCMFSSRADAELCVDFISSIERSQLSSGAWSATHPIIRDNQGPWHISSHEIALALTWIYYQPQVPDAAREITLDILERYFRNWVVPTFVQETVARVPSNDSKQDRCHSGWFDDHTVAPTNTEGWATATVIHFLANYYAVLDDHINRRVIECLQINNDASGYMIDKTASKERRSWKWRDPRPNPPDEDSRAEIWPDLPPYSFQWRRKFKKKQLKKLHKKITKRWLDPSQRKQGSRQLTERLLAPILESPRAQPDRDGGYRAGILPGPAGTGKTSLVKIIAELLEWPFVPVPSSVFFTRGFDGAEVRATEVFEQLSYLNRCVIFFDEFEEFFRDRDTPRDTNWPVHDRTIAAFTTAAMLPRLQALHDKCRCIVILATNYPERIDKAIKRRGRFDFQFYIDYPSPSQAQLFMNLKSVKQSVPVKNLVKQAIIDAFGTQAEDKPTPKLQIAQLLSALRSAERNYSRFDRTEIIRILVQKFTEYSDELPDLGKNAQVKPKQSGTDIR